MPRIVNFIVEFSKDGDLWCCMPECRTGDLQNSYAGFGTTQADALINLGEDIKKHQSNEFPWSVVKCRE